VIRFVLYVYGILSYHGDSGLLMLRPLLVLLSVLQWLCYTVTSSTFFYAIGDFGFYILISIYSLAFIVYRHSMESGSQIIPWPQILISWKRLTSSDYRLPECYLISDSNFIKAFDNIRLSVIDYLMTLSLHVSEDFIFPLYYQVCDTLALPMHC
jgi:hypothetical protein